MTKPNYYLTKAEVTYIKSYLEFSMVHHQALLDFPDAKKAGVNVRLVTKDLKKEENIYVKLGGTLRKKKNA